MNPGFKHHLSSLAVKRKHSASAKVIDGEAQKSQSTTSYHSSLHFSSSSLPLRFSCLFPLTHFIFLAGSFRKSLLSLVQSLDVNLSQSLYLISLHLSLNREPKMTRGQRGMNSKTRTWSIIALGIK